MNKQKEMEIREAIDWAWQNIDIANALEYSELRPGTRKKIKMLTILSNCAKKYLLDKGVNHE